MVVLEITAFVVGLLGPVQLAVECGTKLKRRFQAFRENQIVISELCEDYRTIAENLHALEQVYGGQSLCIEGIHSVLFEQQLRKLEVAVEGAGRLLRKILEEHTRKNWVALLLVATSNSEKLYKLKRDAEKAVAFMSIITGFLMMSHTIGSAREMQQSCVSETLEWFEWKFRRCHEENTTRILDKIDSQPRPVVLAGRALGLIEPRLDYMGHPQELFLPQFRVGLVSLPESKGASLKPPRLKAKPLLKGDMTKEFLLGGDIKILISLFGDKFPKLLREWHYLHPWYYRGQSAESDMSPSDGKMNGPRVLRKLSGSDDLGTSTTRFKDGVYPMIMYDLGDDAFIDTIAAFVEISGGPLRAREMRAEKLAIVALGKGVKWFEGKDCLFVILLRREMQERLLRQNYGLDIARNLIRLQELGRCSARSRIILCFDPYVAFSFRIRVRKVDGEVQYNPSEGYYRRICSSHWRTFSLDSDLDGHRCQGGIALKSFSGS